MIKKILAGLLGLIVVLIIVGFFLPSRIELTRSITIDAPAEYAFEEVDNLDRWNNWSYWNTLDTAMTLSYGDKRSGPGSYYAWQSEEMGNGKLTITESVPFKVIKADLDFMENGTAKSWYNFEPEGESTKMTMGFSSDFGNNPFMRWMGATIFPSEMNKAYDYSLAKIKTIAEAKPKFSVSIKEEEVKPFYYVGIRKTIDAKDESVLSEEMEKLFSTLYNDLEKAKVKIEGYPLSIYHSYSESTMDATCAVPVDEKAKLPKKYERLKREAGRAAVAVHKGNYNTLPNTYSQLDQYIRYKGYNVVGTPMEVYVTDPTVEKDTSKWITNVYYPIQ
jgi:effector-binding domain-containing protein